MLSLLLNVACFICLKTTNDTVQKVGLGCGAVGVLLFAGLLIDSLSGLFERLKSW